VSDRLLFLEVALCLLLVGLVELGEMAVVGLEFDQFELHRRLIKSHLIDVHLTSDTPHFHSRGGATSQKILHTDHAVNIRHKYIGVVSS